MAKAEEKQLTELSFSGREANSNLNETARVYQKAAAAYKRNTNNDLSKNETEWLEVALNDLPADAEIFEVGTGTGRTADFIEKQGFKVLRSDVADDFISDQGVFFDCLNTKLGNKFDLIVANAVLLHLKLDEFDQAIDNLTGHLKPGGRLAFNLKYRPEVKEELIAEKEMPARHFTFWNQTVTEHLNGFSDINLSLTSDDGNQQRWLRIVAYLDN